MFGETDIIFNRDRLETYASRMDCHILSLKRELFDQLIDEFDDIRQDIEAVAE